VVLKDENIMQNFRVYSAATNHVLKTLERTWRPTRFCKVRSIIFIHLSRSGAGHPFCMSCTKRL